jgi:hypothetical protein
MEKKKENLREEFRMTFKYQNVAQHNAIILSYISTRKIPSSVVPIYMHIYVYKYNLFATCI